MSLKTKLISGVLLTTIAIITICSVFTYMAVQSFSDNSKELTNGLSNDVNRDVSGFSGHYAGTLTHHENQNIDNEINYIVNTAKNTLLMATQFEESVSNNSSSITTLFKKISNENPMISKLYIASAAGSINSYPLLKNLPSDFNPTTRPWYVPASKLKKGQYYITDAYIDSESNDYLITISMPVYRNNVFYGVIACDVSLAILTEKIANTKVGETGYVILTDRKGNLLAYKDHKLVDSNTNISSLPIFLEKNGETTFLDTEKVSYIGQVHKETGWEFFSVITLEEIQSFSKTISTNMSKRISSAEKDSANTLSKLFTTQVIVIIVLIVTSIFISFIFARFFIRPINNLSTFMKSVAGGDLTKTMPVKTKDEMGSLFSSVNYMVINFRDMVSKLQTLVKEVEKDAIILKDQSTASSSITETVSSAMGQVSAGSEQLAEDMVNISYNVESNDAAVKMMSTNIQKIVTHANETKTTSSQGKIAMENLSNKMSNITEQALESSNIMKTLDRKLQTINEITALIHGLSEQTNLLSLNASIEAARAGEHGRGFAVVAQEVKKLAEQSSKSVEEITLLIQEIQQSSSRALENIDKGKTYAHEGADLSKETETSLLQIISFINYLSQDIEEIACASELLDNSSESISKSVDSVVAITEETSAGVQEVASTTIEQKRSIEEVQQISINLRELTKELKDSFNHFQV